MNDFHMVRVSFLTIMKGWDSNGNNKAPSPGHAVTVADGDNSYMQWLGGKAYMARESKMTTLDLAVVTD